jgi:exopolysaccharide biosynthesis polyprenyl glycosylphosphotransferase
MRSSASLLLRMSRAVDACLMAASFAYFWDGNAPDQRSRLFADLLVIPGWLAVLGFVGVYESQRVEASATLVRKILTANAIVLTFAALAYLPLSGSRGVGILATVVSIVTVLIVSEKVIVYSVLRVVRRLGHDLRTVCVIGAWEWAEDVARRFDEHAGWGLRVNCIGVGPADARSFVRYPAGDVVASDLSQTLSTEVIDEVLIAVKPHELPNETATLRICEQFGVMGRILLDTREQIDPPRLESFGSEVTLAVGVGPREEWRLSLKRVIDLAGGTALILALSPVLIGTALVVKLSSAGPTLFTQERVGLHGRRFRVYKFRTMVQGAEALLPSLSVRSVTKGPVFKDPADFRITPIGRVLRKFSLDELPQLFNVVKGEMSLVGPRPLPVHESAAITGPFRRRFSMRPGITCLWQINGRSNVDYVTWMNYDLQYVDRWSLGLDALLLLKTIPAVLSGRGAY